MARLLKAGPTTPIPQMQAAGPLGIAT